MLSNALEAGRTSVRNLISVKHSLCLVLAFTMTLLTFAQPATAAEEQAPLEIINQMVQAEIKASKSRQHFSYKRVERSTRTKGHQWVEAVVETSDGRMHRLLSLDGRPLTASEKKAEDDRIASLVQHPDDFRRENQGRKDDEGRTADLLRAMPKAFLFEAAGSEGGCRRIHFKPNPAYQEQTYQDRVIHAIAGDVYVNAADSRLCKLDTHLQHPVEFGFGLLGKVSQNSSFFMSRAPVSPGQWKTSTLRIHVDGNILLLKSVSRQEDSVHSDFKEVPFGLSIRDAADMVNSLKY